MRANDAALRVARGTTLALRAAKPPHPQSPLLAASAEAATALVSMVTSAGGTSAERREEGTQGAPPAAGALVVVTTTGKHSRPPSSSSVSIASSDSGDARMPEVGRPRPEKAQAKRRDGGRVSPGTFFGLAKR